MTRVILMLIAILPVIGCRSATAVPAAQLPPIGFHCVGDPMLTPDDARAVLVACEYLEKKVGKKIEAHYRPRKSNTGYDVDVSDLAGNETGGERRPTGPISSVSISADWQKADHIRW